MTKDFKIPFAFNSEGNLIDINGNILDINYNPVIYSTMVPADNVKEKIEEAKLKSRRGVGYHFKLSTNINSFEKSLLPSNIAPAFEGPTTNTVLSSGSLLIKSTNKVSKIYNI